VRLRAVLLAGVLAASVAACTAAPPNHDVRSGPVSSGPTSPTAHDSSTAPRACGDLDVRGRVTGGIGAASTREAWGIVGRTIRHTSDGGQHWRVQFRGRPGVQLQSMDVLDPTHVWLVAEHGLYWTVDGGRHWHVFVEHCPLIHSVDFVDANHGYAVAGGFDHSLVRGGSLWHTADAGRHWQRLTAPASAQSVCFADGNRGWLGAHGGIFATHDGGQHWRRQLNLTGETANGVITVTCDRGAAWAELYGGGAMSQQAHIVFHLAGGRWQPVYAEQYFPHPGVRVPADSPGSYGGPIQAIGRAAVTIESCPACIGPGSDGAATAVALLAGSTVTRLGSARYLQSPTGIAFPSRRIGWVIGSSYAPFGRKYQAQILRTTDGGRHWSVQLSTRFRAH